MKKRWEKRLYVLVSVVLMSALSLEACKAETVKAVESSKKQGIFVELDGMAVGFTKETGSPFIDENCRTQVPLRVTMEEFGCAVAWEGESQTAIVQKDGIEVQVPVGKNIVLVNGTEKKNDTAAVIKDGRTYLPIRVVLEAFGASVGWDAAAKKVIVSRDGTGSGEGSQQPQQSELAELKVHFIDVGQGDAIFIDNGEKEVLIDGGNNKDGQTVVNYLKPYVDGALDLVIATHPDADHVGGLDTVLANYQVSEVIDSGTTKTTVTFRDYFAAVEGEENCILSYDEDRTIDLGRGATLEIIETGDGYKDANDNSVVSLLRYGAVSVLLTGDMEAQAEQASLGKYTDVDVLKAGHHGSRTSSSKAFLDIVKPEYIIVSAGLGNTYGHPHSEALQRYFDAKATVYGTFLSKDIVMTTNGKTYSFNTEQKVTMGDAGR